MDLLPKLKNDKIYFCKTIALHKGITATKNIFLLSILTGFVIIIGCASTNREGNIISSQTVSQEDLSQKNSELSAFRLGAGDEVKVSVWRQESLDKTVIVPPSGWVTFPLVGDIQIIGLTPFEVRDRIRTGLAKYFSDPQVSVELAAVNSKRVYVLGEVKRPGVMTIMAPISAVEAVSQASGFTVDAKQSKVLLVREKERDQYEIYTLDLKSAIRKGKMDENLILRHGDILYVPPTFVADLERFFQHIAPMINTLVEIERGIVLWPSVQDVLSGNRPKATFIFQP
ncbi:MAG: polysaccharide biosynthesis/export family protein [Promethearchaeota archaeon]